MKKTMTSLALVAALTATSAFAEAEVILNDENVAKITEMLVAQGYEVGKIKLEDGMYEAYTKNDIGKYEVFLNGDFEIVEIRED